MVTAEMQLIEYVQLWIDRGWKAPSEHTQANFLASSPEKRAEDLRLFRIGNERWRAAGEAKRDYEVRLGSW